MSDNILLKIHEELCAIRELLAKGAAAPAAAGSAPVYRQQTNAAGEVVIPQPNKIIQNPGDVQIHFGKNKDRPLSELSERSLEWYASVKEPKCDSSGKPYPPRPQEILLENAARTLWHTQKGTLNGGTPETRTERPAAPPPSSGAAGGDEENVPFSARYYDHG